MDALRSLLLDAARGRFPAANGSVRVLPAPATGARAALLAFTAHLVVAATVDADEIARHAPPGDFDAWSAPAFHGWLADRVAGEPGDLDAVLVAPGRAGTVSELVAADAGVVHPRVARASRFRTDVRVWTDRTGAGVVVVGRGLAGRWEVAFEVDADARGRGIGRRLVGAARRCIPEGEPLFAQVVPANAASVRALFAAGFRPIGTEVLFH
jgi:GNAT superfamily N-acetyltransferase